MPTRDEILTSPLTAFGKTQLFFQWSVDPICRVPWRELLRRLLLDWPAEAALSTPAPSKRFPEHSTTEGTGTQSRFRGVHWYAALKKWQAKFHLYARGEKDQYFHLGYFDSDVDAALAWDKAAREYKGKKARCNFPEGAV
jgi:hypothetical protein